MHCCKSLFDPLLVDETPTALKKRLGLEQRESFMCGDLLRFLAAGGDRRRIAQKAMELG
jgi:hypothetical protein